MANRRYSIATFNVQNNPDMTSAQVFECGKIAAEYDVINFQEIMEKDDHDQLQKAMPNHNFYNTHCPIPIAVHTSLNVTGSGWYPVVKPEAGFTPPRGYSYVDIDLGYDQITDVNNHFINKAWTLTDPRKAERQKLWNEQYHATDAFINSRNRKTYFAGDYNRHVVAPYGTGRGRWVTGMGTIDKIGVTAGNPGVTIIQAGTIHTPSDHALKFVKVQHG